MDTPDSLLGAKKTVWRCLRTVLDISLPMVGVAIILSSVLFLHELHGQITVAMVGILMLEGGVWKVARRLFPNKRQYLPLRHEVDQFIVLIRALNTAALAVKAINSSENRQAFEDIQQSMRQAVERMAEIAGKTEAALAAGRQSILAEKANLGAETHSHR
jgi:hypothetical protein